MKKTAKVFAAAAAMVLVLAGSASAEGLKVGLGLLFPIPLPLPIYQIEHEPSVVTVGLLFPIPVPVPVYDYEYYPEKKTEPETRPAPGSVWRDEGRTGDDTGKRAEYGSLRTSVRPTSAAVYVDGKYAGRADEFSGLDDMLELLPGMHTVEFEAEGYEPYRADVEVTAGGIVDVRYDLRPVR